MDAILSIQSHVVYGYVGNKAATYPLQAMGFDVWPVNTVQFSNHTGYGKWQGQIVAAEQIQQIIRGLFEIEQHHKCTAILSGYLGSAAICHAVAQIVQKFKKINPRVIYLCDPVVGNSTCYVKPEVLEFFQRHLSADVITPNQYEAEILSHILIKSREDLKTVAAYFHQRGIKIVVITGVKISEEQELCIFASDGAHHFIVKTPEYRFDTPVNGAGDLFSSVFLGAYLKHNSLPVALQYATFCLQKALEATQCSQERELQVLSVQYGSIASKLFPPVEAV